jgi:hypothetical protein
MEKVAKDSIISDELIQAYKIKPIPKLELKAA